jgi:hypothetical protein
MTFVYGWISLLLLDGASIRIRKQANLVRRSVKLLNRQRRQKMMQVMGRVKKVRMPNHNPEKLERLVNLAGKLSDEAFKILFPKRQKKGAI